MGGGSFGSTKWQTFKNPWDKRGSPLCPHRALHTLSFWLYYHSPFPPILPHLASWLSFQGLFSYGSHHITFLCQLFSNSMFPYSTALTSAYNCTGRRVKYWVRFILSTRLEAGTLKIVISSLWSGLNSVTSTEGALHKHMVCEWTDEWIRKGKNSLISQAIKPDQI